MVEGNKTTTGDQVKAHSVMTEYPDTAGVKKRKSLMNSEMEAIADQLKIASEQIIAHDKSPDLHDFRRRSHQHAGVRNALEFSFAHLFTTLLGLFAGAYDHYAHDRIEPTNPNSGEK